MATNNQFSIAIHMLAALGFHPDQAKTSAMLAASINTNASFVRRILSQLSQAGLVKTVRGKSGTCELAKNPKAIYLLDIYQAVQPSPLFSIHDYPTQKHCQVSCHIKSSLQNVLHQTEQATFKILKKVTLADVINDLQIGEKP